MDDMTTPHDNQSSTSTSLKENVLTTELDIQSNCVAQAKSPPSSSHRIDILSEDVVDVVKTAATVRILVVDDVSSCRKVLGETCARYFRNIPNVFLETVFADDGVTAIEACEVMQRTGNVFDMILMDNTMTNMHGPAAALAIRASGFTGYMVGVTGNVNADDLKDFKDAGMDKVLGKPPRREEIHLLLQDLVTRSKSSMNV